MADCCKTCDAWRRGYRSGDPPNGWVVNLVNGAPDPFGVCRDAESVVHNGGWTQPLMHQDDWCRKHNQIGRASP